MSRRKVLLDECVDRVLAKEITGYDVLTVPEAGWASIKNGELLCRAQVEFDVFITTDRNLMFQQNLPNMIWRLLSWPPRQTACKIYFRLCLRFLMQFLQPSPVLLLFFKANGGVQPEPR